MLDAGQFTQMYEGASDGLKKVSSEQNFVASLDSFHRQLGATLDYKQQSWKLFAGTSGTYMTVDYKTTFVNGKADEEFIFLVQGDSALLRTYRINSEVLR